MQRKSLQRINELKQALQESRNKENALKKQLDLLLNDKSIGRQAKKMLAR